MKKLTSILMAVVLSNALLTHTSFAEGYIRGDANGDGTFNLSDVILVQKAILGADDVVCLENADVCKNNRIDIFDLCILKRDLLSGDKNIDSNELEVILNEIKNSISGARRYFSPDLYEKTTWTYNKMSEYYGTDFESLETRLFNEDKYSSNISVDYPVIISKDGKVAEDKFYVTYSNETGKTLRILAGKVSAPYDTVYELETNNKTIINGTEVLFACMNSESDVYSFIYADFKKNDIIYRFEGRNMSSKEFLGAVSRFIG